MSGCTSMQLQRLKEGRDKIIEGKPAMCSKEPLEERHKKRPRLEKSREEMTMAELDTWMTPMLREMCVVHYRDGPSSDDLRRR